MIERMFKAWDKKNRKFIDAEKVVINDGKVFRDWRDFEDYVPDEGNIELVWSTGKRGLDEVEIYDGDIVECFTTGISEVVFKSGCFGLRKEGYFFPFSEVHGYCKVIGNRYENPELLGGTS